MHPATKSGTFQILMESVVFSPIIVHNTTQKKDCNITHQGVGRSSEVEHSLMVRWVVGLILHGVDPLSYFSFQPVLHVWCNKAVVCVILSVGWCI